LSALLRARFLNQTAIASSADVLEDRLDSLLPPGVVTKLLALAFEVRHTTSTAEVIALSRRIVAMLEAEAASNPPDSTDSQRLSGGTGVGGIEARSSSSANAGAGGADADANAIAGSLPDLQGSVGSGVGVDTGADTRAGSTTGGAGAGGAQAVDDIAQQTALQNLLSALDTAGQDSDLGQRVEALLNQSASAAENGVTMAVMGKPPLTRFSHSRAVAEARVTTAALRRRLGTLVQAQQIEASWRSRRGHRLETADLYRPATGQAIRFRRRDIREAPETVVALLLDRSGSMTGKITLAGQAALALVLALETVPGVACWAAAFPGTDHRCIDHYIVPLKTFAERASRVAGRFLSLSADGGTPLAHALWRVGFELMQRPESRRLIIVATDGEPNDVGSTQDIIGYCRASGIEVIGLGIGSSLSRVQMTFGRHDAVAMATIGELAPTLFAVLERRLTAAV